MIVQAHGTVAATVGSAVFGQLLGHDSAWDWILKMAIPDENHNRGEKINAKNNRGGLGRMDRPWMCKVVYIGDAGRHDGALHDSPDARCVGRPKD